MGRIGGLVERRVAASRLRAQLLDGGAPSVEAAVERLLAVQAQDGRGFRLAVRARTNGLTAVEVDTALTERRSLLISWLCRGTLHLVRSSDYWWLHSLTAPRMVTANRRRLSQLGVTEAMTDRGVAVIAEQVGDGPKTRGQLRTALDAAGVPTAGQAFVHVLLAAAIRKHLVRGPVRAGETCFVDARRWLTPEDVPDRDTCLAMLGRRYLAGHGPATPTDLAVYAGITASDARQAFAAVAAEARRVGADQYALAADGGADPMPPPRLLGMFDPVLHGWADRTFVTGAHTGVVTSNGMFRATALVDGQVAAVWTLPDGGVSLNAFRPLPARVVAALEIESADVLRFLGLPPADLRIAQP